MKPKVTLLVLRTLGFELWNFPQRSELEMTHDPESPSPWFSLPPFAVGSPLRCGFFAGRFGDLCCGCLQLPGRQELPVAVHTLRDGCSDSQRLSFLAEALTLGQFDHSHIVRLEGVVTRGRPATAHP